MNILHELWKGNINPLDRSVRPGSEYQKTMDTLVAYEARLEKCLDTNADLLEKYSDAQHLLMEIAECEAFTIGFQLGARMAAEVLAGESTELQEIG